MPLYSRNVIPVILAGGTGTRLWPLSQSHCPKQFISVQAGADTLFQQAVGRAACVSDHPPVIIFREQHMGVVLQQLEDIGVTDFTLVPEPVSRNTAPAVAVVAGLVVETVSPDVILLVLAADHIISLPKVFASDVEQGLLDALDDRLVIFGVAPTRPETGYGYIRRGAKLPSGRAYKVDMFIEKPDVMLASQFALQEGYYWNSGILLCRAGKFLQALQQHSPDVYHCCHDAVIKGAWQPPCFLPDRSSLERCRQVSLDNAVLEFTRDAVVVPAKMDWTDIGSWLSMWLSAARDEQGNACGKNVTAIDARNNYISTSHHTVALIGVEDLIVVETEGALLVMNKTHSQQLKRLTEEGPVGTDSASPLTGMTVLPTEATRGDDDENAELL